MAEMIPDEEVRVLFHEWFRGVLERHGVTQARAAFDLGAHPGTVEGWARGQGVPRLGQFVRICFLYGELPSWLAELCPSKPDETQGGSDRGGGSGGSEPDLGLAPTWPARQM